MDLQINGSGDLLLNGSDLQGECCCTPPPPTGMVFWVKGDAGVTSSSGAVSQWADQSGNSRDLAQGTGANQPALHVAGLNGKNYIGFTGSPKFMTTGAWACNQPKTFVWVWRILTSGLVIDHNYFDGLSSSTMLMQAHPGLRCFCGVGDFTDNGVINDAWQIEVIKINGASSSMQTNLLTVFTGNCGSGNCSGLTLGGSGGASGADTNPFDVAEILIYDRILDGTDTTAVQTYLSVKWGITI